MGTLKNRFLIFVLLSTLIACGQKSELEVGESLNESDQINSEDNLIIEDDEVEVVDETKEDSEHFRCLQSVMLEKIAVSSEKANCKKANSRQIAQVNQGNLKKDLFLSKCYQKNNNSCWCDQLIRPNPSSISKFRCTYGNSQVHQLIHPDESTWKNAFEAVSIVKDLEKKRIKTKIIYNWWRPEPYNNNVGGSATRHPYGTSIDVRFKTKTDQNKAFSELCKMRARGRIRAIGYYASTALHFGVGDRRANTWGKSCP